MIRIRVRVLILILIQNGCLPELLGRYKNTRYRTDKCSTNFIAQQIKCTIQLNNISVCQTRAPHREKAEHIWIMLFNKWNCLHSAGFPSSSTFFFLWAMRCDAMWIAMYSTSINDEAGTGYSHGYQLFSRFKRMPSSASSCNNGNPIEIWNKLKGFINS